MIQHRTLCGLCGGSSGVHDTFEGARDDLLDHYARDHRVPASEVTAMTVSHRDGPKGGWTSPRLASLEYLENSEVIAEMRGGRHQIWSQPRRREDA